MNKIHGFVREGSTATGEKRVVRFSRPEGGKEMPVIAYLFKGKGLLEPYRDSVAKPEIKYAAKPEPKKTGIIATQECANDGGKYFPAHGDGGMGHIESGDGYKRLFTELATS